MGNFLLGVGATIVALGVLGYLGFRLFRRGPLTFEIDGFYSHVVDGDVGPFIRDADVVVGAWSTAILDAVYHRKPLVLFTTPSNIRTRYPPKLTKLVKRCSGWATGDIMGVLSLDCVQQVIRPAH